MIDAIIKMSLRNRLVVIFFVLLVGALGVRAMKQLPIDAVPDVTNIQVQVLTNAPALGPLEIERFVVTGDVVDNPDATLEQFVVEHSLRSWIDTFETDHGVRLTFRPDAASRNAAVASTERAASSKAAPPPPVADHRIPQEKTAHGIHQRRPPIHHGL